MLNGIEVLQSRAWESLVAQVEVKKILMHIRCPIVRGSGRTKRQGFLHPKERRIVMVSAAMSCHVS